MSRWCVVVFEQREEIEPPDWTKIPDDRRARVQERWEGNLRWERRTERWYESQVTMLSKGRNVISVTPEEK